MNPPPFSFLALFTAATEALADDALTKRYELKKKVLFTPADGSKPYYL